jgi:UDP-N-acetylglucosamine--N-acetylmuramyl-(pentapeptide) pyrophosphoryl-undecaprenol N-acetylglucosamine transferase
MNNPATILIMAGGTGGHIFPALAVAQALQSQSQVVWLGSVGGMEAKLIAQYQIPIHLINIKGLRGKSKLTLLFAPVKILWATLQAMRIIWLVKPKVVIGMGGFASGPGGIAAWLMGKPLIIHEQNAVAGLTNRILSKLAKYNLQAFPMSFARAITVGNPVRQEIRLLYNQNQRHIHQPRRILIFGGSLGAKPFNDILPTALQHLNIDIIVKHQTGINDYKSVQAAYANANFTVEVVDFIQDMAQAYAWADIVICRAGALTISELAHAGVASILVPLPHAVDDHQSHNARYLSDKQAAILLPQSELQVNNIVNLLTELLSQPQKLMQMGQAARLQANPDSTDQIVRIIQNLL